MRIRRRPQLSLTSPQNTTNPSSQIQPISNAREEKGILLHQDHVLCTHDPSQSDLNHKPTNKQVVKEEKEVELDDDDDDDDDSSISHKTLDAQVHNNERSGETNHEALILSNGKKRKAPRVLMEGSRCSRVNGRGWRCSQQTLIGYSLCEHHLGKGRLRSITSVAKNPKKRGTVDQKD